MVYEEGIDFSSQELMAMMKKSVVELKGDVFLKKQQLNARSLRAEIFLENYNQKLKYYALSDDVKVVEKVAIGDGKFITRKAFAEKLEGYAQEKKIILTGYPKVYQQEDIIKGNKITMIENNEVIEVDDSSSSFNIKEDDK